MDYENLIEQLRDEALFQRTRHNRLVIADELESAATAIETLLAERKAAAEGLLELGKVIDDCSKRLKRM